VILLTGGNGLLGRQLQDLINCVAPTREEFDILNPPALPDDISVIVHAAAYTDVAKAQTDLLTATEVNVRGTRNMCAYGLPLVYISTEYVFDGTKGNYSEEDITNPLNSYALTKEQGERYVRTLADHLIIRTLFKPDPFKHEKAFIDQWTTGDYVDVIAPMIAKAINLFDMGYIRGTLHIGTEKKSTYELASRSRRVSAIRRSNIDIPMPRDTSLNLSKWESIQCLIQ